MRLTESYLRKIIKEELKKTAGLHEAGFFNSIESGARSLGDTFGVSNSSGKKVKSDASEILYGPDRSLLTPKQMGELEKIAKMGQNQANMESPTLASIKRHIASIKRQIDSVRQDQDRKDGQEANRYNEKTKMGAGREENEKSEIKDQIEKLLRKKYSSNPPREIRDEPGNFVQDDPDYVADERGYTKTTQRIADDDIDSMSLQQLKNYFEKLNPSRLKY